MMITLRVKASGTGWIVNWSHFKQGELVLCSRWSSLLTTVLTNVITDLVEESKILDPNCTIIPLFPNGFTTSSFDLVIKGENFQIICGRRLVRGFFPLNPFAAEFGKNYDVLLTISTDVNDIEKTLVEKIRQKYDCEIELNSV